MEENDHSQLYCVFNETIAYLKSLLTDFEKVFENEEIKKEFPLVRAAYMEAIIVNLGKIFNATRNDKFGITQLKSISKKKEKADLENITEAHKNIINKVNVNRNERFSHTGKKHHELCFSESEISAMKKNIIDNYKEDKEKVDQMFSKMPRATHKGEERYTINDLREDLPEINDLLGKLDKILLNILMSYYRK